MATIPYYPNGIIRRQPRSNLHVSTGHISCHLRKFLYHRFCKNWWIKYKLVRQVYGLSRMAYSSARKSSCHFTQILLVLLVLHNQGCEEYQKTLRHIAINFVATAKSKISKRNPLQPVSTAELKQPANLLQPLPIVKQISPTSSSVEGLLLFHNKIVILEVMNHFSKYAHFQPLL